MRISLRHAAGGLAAAGGGILLRPGTRANRAARDQVDALARRLRYLAGLLQGESYRLKGGHPDPEVSGNVLADRVRSSLGPIEKRLDLPHVHVMVEDHVVLLHGEVDSQHDAAEIESAVGAVSGVRGVESYLHIGLSRGDTRPSAGRAADQPSAARRRLVDAAIASGVAPAKAPAVVRAVLATFAERLPSGERDHVASHLPVDVRGMFAPPRRLHKVAPARTAAELVDRIAAGTDELPEGKADEVTLAVVRELSALVPEEAADVRAVLPPELREMWSLR